MKAYSFRLQGVQRVRAVEVARARQRVAALARSLAAARSRELEITSRYSSRIELLGEAPAQEFVANHEHEGHLARALVVAAEERRVIEAQLCRARGDAAQAEIRAGVLDRLDERRRSEWVADCAHEVVLELDELATFRAANTAEADSVD